MAGKSEERDGGKGGTKKKGLAPFASLEDLSDDSPPDDKHRLTLPGIKEDPSPSGGSDGHRPSITPRIDISRASSSSHHDDSSPERELFSGGAEGGGTTKIGLGFTEEMAQELRKSTEELDFQDPEEETKSRRKKLQHQQQAVTKYELEALSEKENRERKDSTCSEGGLLLIGGRTSRLSSIGSVASGGSAASHISVGSAISAHSRLSATSHISGQSHLSAASNYSRASRCSSPHKMLLETSFCGPKPIPTLSLEAEYPPSESVEATLLARKTDITGAVLPPEESMKPTKSSTSKTNLETRGASGKSNTLEVRTNKASRSHSERIAKTTGPAVVAARSSSARSHKRPEVKKKYDENALVRIIPLHGSIDDSDDTLAPEEIEDATNSPNDQRGPPQGAADYGIYIPLKGPIDDPVIREVLLGSSRVPPSKTKAIKTVSQPPPGPTLKTPKVEESDLVRFISLHGDDDEDLRRERAKTEQQQRPSSRNSQNVQFKSRNDGTNSHVQSEWPPIKKSITPEPKSKCKPSTLDVTSKNGRPAQSMTNLPRDESRTPSPASSFARSLLFRRSSDSSGSSRKSANTSGSSDSRPKKDCKNKSMFSTLFKKSPKDTTPKKTPEKPAIDPKISNVEFKFNQQKEPETIYIPLHSPDSVIKPCVFTEPDEITLDAEEHDKKSTKLSPRGTKEEDSDLLRSVKKVLENKNIIVVDVINSDSAVCYEAILETPPTTRASASRKSCEVVPSEDIGVIELENLECEPRVRLSGNSSSRVDKSPERPETEELSFERQIIEELEKKLSETDNSYSVPKPSDATVEVAFEVHPRSLSRDSLSKAVMEVHSVLDDNDMERVKKLGRKESEDKQSLHGDLAFENQFSVESPSSQFGGNIQKELSSGSKISLQPTREDNEEKRSSESEVDLSGAAGEVKAAVADETDEERKVLFHQTESVEDELPYVPTTLPQERSVALPIIPVRQRVSEVKTWPVERPRSTTPIQPSNLEEYAATHDSTNSKITNSEKMQITLPRAEALGRRNSQGRAKPWTQFAEEVLQSPKESKKRVNGGISASDQVDVVSSGSPLRSSAAISDPPPPPLPPRSAYPSLPQQQPQWVMFDEPTPERRRPPKRITTLPPLRHPQSSPSSSPALYSYVNPEECSCECHEAQSKSPDDLAAAPSASPSSQCSKFPDSQSTCPFQNDSRTDKRYR